MNHNLIYCLGHLIRPSIKSKISIKVRRKIKSHFKSSRKDNQEISLTLCPALHKLFLNLFKRTSNLNYFTRARYFDPLWRGEEGSCIRWRVENITLIQFENFSFKNCSSKNISNTLKQDQSGLWEHIGDGSEWF